MENTMSKKSPDSRVDKVKKQESKYDANVLRDLIRNGKTASKSCWQWILVISRFEELRFETDRY